MQASDTGEGKGYEEPEPGTYTAVCSTLIDIGTQTNEYDGEKKVAHKIIIGWTLDEHKTDGKPFKVSSFYTLSLHEKANLRKHLEAWRGVAFTPEELKGFEMRNILGKSCMLTLVKNDKGKTKVAGVSKMPKGLTSPTVDEKDLVFFDLTSYDEKVYDGFSEKLKKIIAQSPEHHGIMSVRREQAAPAGKSDGPAEDVPF
jgi:hypothetical protein